MINSHSGEQRIAFILARGGSKRIPRKNARLMVGKPLVRWAIDASLAAGMFDQVVVSTDDLEIAEIARAGGARVPTLRPAHLASDTTSSLEVILHELEGFPRCTLGVLVQPTSPLLVAADIVGAVRLLEQKDARSVVSVCEAPVSPATLFSIEDDAYALRAVSQPARKVPYDQGHQWVALNGAIYAFRPDWLKTSRNFVDTGTLAYVMPRERSIDVDVEFDWMLAELLLQLRQGSR